jgi:iron complex outermembrane receptor protein
MDVKDRTIARAVAVALGLAAAMPAGADTSAAGAEGRAQLDEVVVTARKTAERLQDVPVAVDAFTAADIAERNVRSLSDIATLTPGLNFEEYSGGFGTPVIRGAAQGRVTDLDQNVSSFFDGIYLPRQYLVNPGVVGLERIEVVKGPQSALYGRNAFMGAINYVSKTPGDELAISAEATAGNDERYDLIADLSGPLVPGLLAGRVAAGYSTFDGDIENSHPNAGASFPSRRGTEGNVGGFENRSYQARFVLTPLDGLSVDLGYSRFELFDESRAASRKQGWNGFGSDLNCSPITRNVPGRVPPATTFPGLYCGPLQSGFRGLPGGGPAEADAVIDPRAVGVDSRMNLLRGHVDYELNDALTFVYEYGKINARAKSGGNLDRDPVLGTLGIFFVPAAVDCVPPGRRCNRFQGTPVGDLNYVSHEARAQFQLDERRTFMLGAFTSRLRDFDRFALLANAPLRGTDPLTLGTFPIVASAGGNRVDARAVFGRADWGFTDALRLGVEARYAEETKRVFPQLSSIAPPGTPPPPARGDKWYAFTPRVSLDWKYTPDTMFYASAAKGVKSGGFNLGANPNAPAESVFAPDENWTYEIGTKNVILDGRLRLDAAVFYVDWSNQQISCTGTPLNPALTGPAIICNLGAATIQGAEAEVVYQFNDAFSFNLGAAYNDAEIDDGVISQRIRDFGVCVSNTVCPSSGAVGGNQLARQSKTSATAGVRFETPVSSTLSFFAGADVGYKSKQYVEELNLAWVPSRTLANARAGVRGDAWEISGWVKNLADKDYVASAFFIQANNAPFNEYVPITGTRRQYGITGRYNWGGSR